MKTDLLPEEKGLTILCVTPKQLDWIKFAMELQKENAFVSALFKIMLHIMSFFSEFSFFF